MFRRRRYNTLLVVTLVVGARRGLGSIVPNHSELEPSCGVPHRLGGATEDGGLRQTGPGGQPQAPPFSTTNLVLSRTRATVE